MDVIVISALIMIIMSLFNIKIKLLFIKPEKGFSCLSVGALFFKKRWYFKLNKFKLEIYNKKHEHKRTLTLEDVARLKAKQKYVPIKERKAKSAFWSHVLNNTTVGVKEISVKAGLNDAFACALVVGSVQALINAVFAVYSKNFRAKKGCRVIVSPVFNKNLLTVKVDCIIGTKPWHIIRGYLNYKKLRK